MADDPHAHRLLDIINSSWMSQVVHVAAELQIADHLSSGPKPADTLAAATNTHVESLRRLLRALATLDICREHGDGTFSLTPMGELLQSDSPRSLRSWSIWWGNHLWPVWGHLLYSVRTGKSARAMLTGAEGFDHLQRDPAAAAVFNQALVELTRLTTQAIVGAYDFSSLKKIVDVGGGYGQLLVAILQASPAASGVLFDLPHAVEGARTHIAAAGEADRCEFVAGDFFRSVPAGGDAYVLKSILHDWPDGPCLEILRSCRAACGDRSRLLLVERILPAVLDSSPAHQSAARSDLTMLVALGAQERTEKQFRDLLAASGFRFSRIIPCESIVSIIEAFPA